MPLPLTGPSNVVTSTEFQCSLSAIVPNNQQQTAGVTVNSISNITSFIDHHHHPPVSTSDSLLSDSECSDLFKLHKRLNISLEDTINSDICKLVVKNKWSNIILDPLSSIQPYIVNLSKRSLSQDEESLL